MDVVVIRALLWVFVRKPDPWVAKFRRRIVDAEATEAYRAGIVEDMERHAPWH